MPDNNSSPSPHSSRTAWQLPDGVPKGTWDYTQAESIARDYDGYFQDHGLLAFDQQLLAEWFDKPGTVIDFGCGTGRALKDLLFRGMVGVGIDLSQPMLQQASEQLQSYADRFFPVRANLVHLDCIAPETADYGICLFSSLGMIEGKQNRATALANMVRTLKPNGKLVLHVHNFWFNMYDPGDPWWLLKSLFRKTGKDRGDKTYDYRGIRDFYLHVFTRRELLSMLRVAGLRIEHWIPLRAKCDGKLRAPGLFQSFRASGWIVCCEKILRPSDE